MQINADKSKIMAFHETAQQKNARQKPRKREAKTYTLPHSTCCHHFPTRDHSNNGMSMRKHSAV